MTQPRDFTPEPRRLPAAEQLTAMVTTTRSLAQWLLFLTIVNVVVTLYIADFVYKIENFLQHF